MNSARTVRDVKFEDNLQSLVAMCRTCLKTIELISLFDESESVCARDMLLACMSIKVEVNDNMPQYICKNCLKELQDCYNFYTRYQKSQEILITTLNCNARKNTDIICSSPITEEEKIKHDDVSEEIIFTYTRVDDESEHNDSNLSREQKNQEPNYNHWNLNAINSDLKKKKLKMRQHDLKNAFQPTTEVTVQTIFPCTFCDKVFESRSKLHYHRKKAKHQKSKNMCSKCGKIFVSNSKLIQHMRVHSKERPFKCNVCQQSFNTNGNLTRHLKTHSGERSFICEKCGKGFIQSTTLKRHRKVHVHQSENADDGFKCSFCGLLFKQMSRYKMHVTKHLPARPEVVEKEDLVREALTQKPSVEENLYTCSVCSRTFRTKPFLRRHILTHGEKKFLCSECGKCFVTKAGLESHLKVHTGEKPHKCIICHKSFAHFSSFNSHILTHTGHKPYKCDTCGRLFTQQSHLAYHQRTHTGEKPYVCSYCGKAFALNGNLTVHMRTHTGETPFRCDICDHGFYDSSNLNKHYRRHEKTGTFKEKQCNLKIAT